MPTNSPYVTIDDAEALLKLCLNNGTLKAMIPNSAWVGSSDKTMAAYIITGYAQKQSERRNYLTLTATHLKSAQSYELYLPTVLGFGSTLSYTPKTRVEVLRELVPPPPMRLPADKRATEFAIISEAMQKPNHKIGILDGLGSRNRRALVKQGIPPSSIVQFECDPTAAFYQQLVSFLTGWKIKVVFGRVETALSAHGPFSSLYLDYCGDADANTLTRVLTRVKPSVAMITKGRRMCRQPYPSWGKVAHRYNHTTVTCQIQVRSAKAVKAVRDLVREHRFDGIDDVASGSSGLWVRIRWQDSSTTWERACEIVESAEPRAVLKALEAHSTQAIVRKATQLLASTGDLR